MLCLRPARCLLPLSALHNKAVFPFFALTSPTRRLLSVSYWCSEHPSGGGAFSFRTPSGVSPHAGVLPNAPYKQPLDAIFFVWRPARWANWMFEESPLPLAACLFHLSSHSRGEQQIVPLSCTPQLGSALTFNSLSTPPPLLATLSH